MPETQEHLSGDRHGWPGMPETQEHLSGDRHGWPGMPEMQEHFSVWQPRMASWRAHFVFAPSRRYV